MRTLLVFALASTSLVGQDVVQIVTNLDRSIEFYRDAIGLQISSGPQSLVFSADTTRSSLYDAPGAQSRSATLKIPDSNATIELIEFQGLNAKPLRPLLVDPGAIKLSFVVQNLEAIKTRLAGIKAVEWVSAQNGTLLVRDPVGFFVELRDLSNGWLPTARDPEASLALTMQDREKAVRFYQDVLGFQDYYWVEDGRRVGKRKFNAPGSELGLILEDPAAISEYNPPNRQPVRAQVHDAGAGILRLRVSNFDATINALKASGATVVTSAGTRSSIVRDSNNILWHVIEQ